MDRTDTVNVPLREGHVRAIRWAIKAAIAAASSQDEIPSDERMEIIARMSVLDEYLVSSFLEANKQSTLGDLHPRGEQLHLDV